jgi:hypothetical protein
VPVSSLSGSSPLLFGVCNVERAVIRWGMDSGGDCESSMLEEMLGPGKGRRELQFDEFYTSYFRRILGLFITEREM